jgi:hypothetical protein
MRILRIALGLEFHFYFHSRHPLGLRAGQEAHLSGECGLSTILRQAGGRQAGLTT